MTKPRPPNRVKGEAVYGATQDEVFRLTCAFSAIRDPKTRFNILATLEEWAEAQWHEQQS